MYYKVFLDTNIYDGANYSFHNAMFSLLRKMTEDGALQLKINSVVEGEVKKHIGRDVKVVAKKNCLRLLKIEAYRHFGIFHLSGLPDDSKSEGLGAEGRRGI